MSRELASLDIANLVSARIPPEEFERRAKTPLTDAEAEEIAELVAWFTRRYPTAKDRLDYVRRKMRDVAPPPDCPAPGGDLRETARRLARAHRTAGLVEVTRSAPTTGEPLAFGFLARPDLGVPFACQIVVLSVEEWESVVAERLVLPHPFELARLEPV